MRVLRRVLSVGSLVLAVLALSACGGGGGDDGVGSDDGSSSGGSGDDGSGSGDGGGSDPVAFELRDPTPGEDDNFGAHVLILENGNIVVSDPGDSSIAENNGAVHLYHSDTRALIASIYGDQAQDYLGSNGLTAVGGSRFVVTSPRDNSGSIIDAGSVRLLNGVTGSQISAISGEQARDQLGSKGITVLVNGNYVINSPSDDNGAAVDAGSVRLMNASTGAEVSSLRGDERESVGRGGVYPLGNSNFVVPSAEEDNGLVAFAGSVRLINGASGAIISTARGEQNRSPLGSGGVTALPNNNYVVTSPSDDDGSTSIGGSVRLFSGSSGAQISVLFGDGGGDFFITEILALANNNYVIIAPSDTRGDIFDAEYTREAGSVRLMSGATGDQINVLYGDQSEDSLGFRRRFFGTVGAAGAVLPNDNFVVASSLDDQPSMSDVGSVRLFDGNTGAQISALFGDSSNDQLGSEGVTALSNSNYVIASNFDSDGAIESAGSVRLMDGTTGNAIGATLFGDQVEDRLASEPGSVVALNNGHYVVASPNDDDGAVENAGSVRLFDGSTGVQISALIGDQANDRLGSDFLRGGFAVTPLGSENYVVLSRFDDDSASGIINAGSVRLLNSGTGQQSSNFVGRSISDMASGVYDPSVTVPADGSYFLLGAPMWDNNGNDDSGLVRLIPR